MRSKSSQQKINSLPSTLSTQSRNPNEKLITDPRVLNYADVIRSLHQDWEPHPGQIRVGKAIFNDNIKDVFVQCGRKWGKTEIILYCLWRWAQINPGSSCYYISPYFKQSKEIVWANRRVQTFGPRRWLHDGSRGVNNTELRLNFKNDSFIKLDGSDNFEAYRGIEPHLVVYEEFKDFRPEFHMAMNPNRSVFNAPLISIGTPPDRECQFTDMAKEYKQNSSKLFIKAPSEDNPHNDKEFLRKEREALYARGEGDVWEREYMAEFVPGGISKIFPMLRKDQHVKPHDALIAKLMKDRKKLQWFLMTDPAASTIFGALFAALNPYTKEWFIVDEIYESEQQRMTVDQIGSRMMRMKAQYSPDEWTQGYDEASSWFANEMLNRFNEFFVPTHKAQNKKDVGLSIIKDAMLYRKIHISDRCTNLFWELDNYYKDKTGKIPKMNDHLIDCLRYLFAMAYYELNERPEPLPEEKDETFRGKRISDDFPGFDPFGEQRHDSSDYNAGDLWR